MKEECPYCFAHIEKKDIIPDIELQRKIFNIPNGKLDETLKIIDKPELINQLKEYYHATSNKDLERLSYNDWRFAIPEEISDDGISVPRAPRVMLVGDDHWFDIHSLSDKMQEIVTGRWNNRHRR